MWLTKHNFQGIIHEIHIEGMIISESFKVTAIFKNCPHLKKNLHIIFSISVKKCDRDKDQDWIWLD